MSRAGKRQMITLLIVFAVIAAVFWMFWQMRWNAYEEELNSAEWYEVTAEYDHSDLYTVREETYNKTGNSYYEYVDYYDWYYTYVAEDGSVHTYVSKRHSSETAGGSVTILVDKADPAHSLEIQSKETHSMLEGTMMHMLMAAMLPCIGAAVLIPVAGGAARRRRR